MPVILEWLLILWFAFTVQRRAAKGGRRQLERGKRILQGGKRLAGFGNRHLGRTVRRFRILRRGRRRCGRALLFVGDFYVCFCVRRNGEQNPRRFQLESLRCALFFQVIAARFQRKLGHAVRAGDEVGHPLIAVHRINGKGRAGKPRPGACRRLRNPQSTGLFVLRYFFILYRNFCCFIDGNLKGYFLAVLLVALRVLQFPQIVAACVQIQLGGAVLTGFTSLILPRCCHKCRKQHFLIPRRCLCPP